MAPRFHEETVVARIQRDPKFARALYAEAASALLDGETAEGLSKLRDLVNAQISFKELARQTGLGRNPFTGCRTETATPPRATWA